MIRTAVIAILVGTVVLSGCSRSAEQNAREEPTTRPLAPPLAAQGATAKLNVTTAQPKSGQVVTVRLTLKDRDGQPISDASVKAVFDMAMGSTQMRQQANLEWNGTEYEGSYKLSMVGTWNINVEVHQNNALLLSMPSSVKLN